MTSRLFNALSCFIVVSLLLITGCSKDSTPVTDTPEDDTQISLSIRFEENSEFASVAKSAEAVVSGDDFEDMVAILTIGKNTVSGAVKEVPAGKERCVQVNVYDDKDNLCYVGKTIVDVAADEEIKAVINLYKVDETGTIIIEGVVIDNNNTDYFTEEELNAIVKKMAIAAKVDPEKVVAVLKKGGKFYETKWKKSQLPEIEKIIAGAIKKVSGNTGEYLSEKELDELVKKMCVDAKIEYEKVVAVLKEGKKFYETKWKKEQLKEVVALIEEAIKKVSGNTNEYFTLKELCAIVEKMAADAKKDIDDVYTILKKEGKLFETKWSYKQEGEVIQIIEAAVAKAKDSDGCFTTYQLASMAKDMAMDAKKDVEHVLTILKKETKLFEIKWKYEQKEEVIKLIAEAVKKAKDATITGEYFTEKELLSIAKGMAVKAKKDVDDVIAILKKEGKLFSTKWKYKQKEEVMKIIAEAVKKAKDATITGEYLTVDELNAIVKKMAEAAKVDAEKVMAVLKKGGKFYQTKWKKEREKEVIALIEAAIKEIS